MGFKRCPKGHLFDGRYSNICPYCHLPATDSAADMTNDAGLKPLRNNINPAYGWLVCIEGPIQGYSFDLHKGKNFIGSAEDMDIRLIGDEQIAGSKHAVIAYDYKERQFMLLPGTLGDMVYLGESAVYKPTLLKDLNVIQIGRTKLLFMSLCGKNFTWD